jgi:hypothetical protein
MLPPARMGEECVRKRSGRGLFSCPRYCYLLLLKEMIWSRHWWLTPVILATQEAKIRRIVVKSHPRANSL